MSLPFNFSQIIKATAVMSSQSKSQSAIWISPRLLLSTLHLYDWNRDDPSFEECERLRIDGETFSVENEISSQVLSKYLPKVQLVRFDVERDIGIFKLQDQFSSSSAFANPDWILEYDQLDNPELKGAKVACIGYSSKISETDARNVQYAAWIQLQQNIQGLVLSVSLH